MAGICGIVRFDGESIGENTIQLMADAVTHRGVDGIHIWQDINSDWDILH